MGAIPSSVPFGTDPFIEMVWLGNGNGAGAAGAIGAMPSMVPRRFWVVAAGGPAGGAVKVAAAAVALLIASSGGPPEAPRGAMPSIVPLREADG